MRQSRGMRWWLFWGSAGLIAYTYIGFPLLLVLRGLVRRPAPTPPALPPEELPSVSIIIAAYNEAAVIRAKLDNALALDYPRHKLEIIVASDGSTDATNALVAGYAAPEVRLLGLPRQGKNQTLNAAVAEARGEILVFSDADTVLGADSLRLLAAHFADPLVGGVGGEHRYPAPDQGYIDLKRRLKQIQSSSGTMSAAEGQIYAIRRVLFQPVPSGVTDDFYISLGVPAAHRRLVFEPGAWAHAMDSAARQGAFPRKVRIMTRWLRTLWARRRLLNPFEYGFYTLQFVSHKVLRRLIVVPLLALTVTAPALWRRGWPYKLATLGQLGLHGCAALAHLLRGRPVTQRKIIRVSYYFDVDNLGVIVAAYKLLRGERRDIWNPQGETAATGQPTPTVAEIAARNGHVPALADAIQAE